MNTKWEESFDDEFDGLWLDGMTDYETDKSYDKEETIGMLKAFIKDQITKAEKRGFDLGVELKEKGLDKAVEAIQDNHSSSDMPECKCFEMPLQQEENGHTRYCERLSEELKVTTDAQITKAQQEIAESIIEDMELDTECRGCNLIHGCECEPITIDELID